MHGSVLAHKLQIYGVEHKTTSLEGMEITLAKCLWSPDERNGVLKQTGKLETD